MTAFELTIIVFGIFWTGVIVGIEVSDRFWEPLWKTASDGWDRNVRKRLEEKLKATNQAEGGDAH